MAAKMYGQFLLKALNKEVDWDSDTIKVALLTSAYSPNQDTQVYFSDVSGNEVTGTNYTAGGATLGSKTITYDTGTNVIKLDGADVTWASSTITARFAVVYDDTPASQKPLVGYLDFGSDQSSVNGDFTITWDAAGIARITVS